MIQIIQGVAAVALLGLLYVALFVAFGLVMDAFEAPRRHLDSARKLERIEKAIRRLEEARRRERES